MTTSPSSTRKGRVVLRALLAALAMVLAGITPALASAQGSAVLTQDSLSAAPAAQPSAAACTRNYKAAVAERYDARTGNAAVYVRQKLCQQLVVQTAVWVELNPGLGRAHLFPQVRQAVSAVFRFQNPTGRWVAINAPTHSVCYTQIDTYAALGRAPRIPPRLDRGGRGNGEDSYLSNFASGPGTYTAPNLGNGNCATPVPAAPVAKFACANDCTGNGTWTLVAANRTVWTEQLYYQVVRPVPNGNPVVSTSQVYSLAPGRGLALKVPSRHKDQLVVLRRFTFSPTWTKTIQVADCPPQPAFSHQESDNCNCLGGSNGSNTFTLVPNALGDGQELRVLRGTATVLTLDRNHLTGAVPFSGGYDLRVQIRSQHLNHTWTPWQNAKGGHYLKGA